MTQAPLKHRALRGVTWAAVGGNGAQILAFVMFVLISRVVGPEAFGTVAISLLLVETARAFTSECVAVNLVSQGRLSTAAFNAGFVMSVGAAILASLALAAAAPALAQLFQARGLATVLPQMAPLLVVHALARMFEAELSIRMEFKALAFRSIGAVALGGAAGIFSAYAGHGVLALVLQQWVAALVSLLLLGLPARWRPGLSWDRADFVTLARQSATMAPAGLITNLRQTLDGLAVASFSGAAAAGLYNLAKRARLALQLGLIAAVGRVSLPTFARLKENTPRLASAVNEAMRLSAITAIPVFVGLAAIAPELIEVMLGPAWRAAAGPMALLMTGGALMVTTRLCENLLLVWSRRDTIVALNVAALVLLLVLFAVVGRYGPAAIAAAVVLENVLHNIAAWLLTIRCVPELRTRAYLINVWVPMAISLAMLALLGLLRSADVIDGLSASVRLVLFVCVGALFYLVAAWTFARPAMRAALSATRTVLSAPPPAKT